MVEEQLKYPIGRFVPQPFSEEKKQEWLADIKFLPNILEAAVQDLDSFQLNTPYREGGWSVHQVVHHLADSHMNAYTRCKLGYTEENAVIRPYNENAWAKTRDVLDLPINYSLTILHPLHHRWHYFLSLFTTEDWARTVFHPQHNREFSLWDQLGIYSWHGRHHTAHITSLRERMKW